MCVATNGISSRSDSYSSARQMQGVIVSCIEVAAVKETKDDEEEEARKKLLHESGGA